MSGTKPLIFVCKKQGVPENSGTESPAATS
jgi:hypothetical protein